MKDFGVTTSLIMVFGFVFNLVVARFTKFKYIFLTGQHNLFFAAMLAVVLGWAGFSNTVIVIVGSISWVLVPRSSPPLVRRVCAPSPVAMTSVSVTIAPSPTAQPPGWAAKLVTPEDSTEKINVPKSLNFFRDYVPAISVTMLVFYYIAALVAGKEAVDAISGGVHWLLFPPFIQSLTFAGAVYVIITGVRMFLGEMVPAFIGISEKFIPPMPSPRVGLPPVVFPPYAPTAVILGFLSATQLV